MKKICFHYSPLYRKQSVFCICCSFVVWNFVLLSNLLNRCIMLTNLAHSYLHFSTASPIVHLFCVLYKTSLFSHFFLKKSSNNNQKFIDELVTIRKHIYSLSKLFVIILHIVTICIII